MVEGTRSHCGQNVPIYKKDALWSSGPHLQLPGPEYFVVVVLQ